jgi:phosphoglycerol transferase MdoB-like AlkP superfamily enzyme
MKTLFPTRFSILNGFILFFLIVSFLLRSSFLIWNFSEVETDFLSLMRTFGTGLFYDLGTISFFAFVAAMYFLIFPKRFYGSLADRIMCYAGFVLGIFILYFSFFAEVTFWDEFQRRFNFIAVDYLIYTYEVVKNINESYPIPLLLSGIGILVLLTVYAFKRMGIFESAFSSNTTLKQKLIPTFSISIVALVFLFFVKNEDAEFSTNRYNNELSKTGIYSFFAAFRNNELSYPDFYRTEDLELAFQAVNKGTFSEKDSLLEPQHSIFRYINNQGEEQKPNVIFICVESLSAKYLGVYGNQDNLTPNLDSLANAGIQFSNLYATGTRTVRGMEAITLSIPPTPGRSIVKRTKNQDLFTIGEVFKQKGYSRTFFYGGDGYFDNMDKFFSGNGFDIVDRGRGLLPEGDIVTKRTNIEDSEVTFENAWGVQDEDLYRKVIKEADKATESGKPFFNFIMTTSNHKPYTYAENRIDIPSGTGRNGAIKYTDYAIGKFFEEARTKAWFDNTVFVIMADHCASSAGKWELDVANYQIPAIIVNLKNSEPKSLIQLSSQIDIFPSLFGLLGWDYKSNLFGKDVFKMKPGEERAFVGNYRKLGLLKENQLMVLGDQKTANFYQWNPVKETLNLQPMEEPFLKETIAYYQVASYLYDENGLQLRN